MDQAEYIIEKIAKLGIDSTEDVLRQYLSDEQETYARELIGREYANSYAMRHPFITGIPTLGIAPSIATNAAQANVVRSLVRKYPELLTNQNRLAEEARQRRLAEAELARQRRLEEYKLETERLQATQMERATNAAARMVPLLTSAYVAGKRLDNTYEKEQRYGA